MEKFTLQKNLLLEGSEEDLISKQILQKKERLLIHVTMS